MGGLVLPSQGIVRLRDEGRIFSLGDILDSQIQPASLDLTIANECHRLRASFVPDNKRVTEALSSRSMHNFNFGAEGALLEKDVVYLFPLKEKLILPKRFSVRSNPKSSTGRVDLFVRLITDYSSKYDRANGSNLYLEVFSSSFPFLVKPGLTFNQIRFYEGEGHISDRDIKNLHKKKPIIYQDNKPIQLEKLVLQDGLYLRVDLDLDVVGYSSVKNPISAIDLTKVKGNKKEDFWEEITRPADKKLIMNPQDFYLLSTKEVLSVPLDYCAEVVAFEADTGELRTHYAGFIDPGFEGNLTLEARARDAPYELTDGKIITRIVFHKLKEKSDKIYGKDLKSNYKGQRGPKLSKIFY